MLVARGCTRGLEHGVGGGLSRGDGGGRVAAYFEFVFLGTRLSLTWICPAVCRCRYNRSRETRLGGGASSHGGPCDPAYGRIDLFCDRTGRGPTPARFRAGKLQSFGRRIAASGEKPGCSG